MSGEVLATKWPTLVLRNAGTNKCMVADDKDDMLSSVKTAPCNQGDTNQRFYMFDDQDKLKTSKGSCVVVTRRQDLALAWNPHERVSLVGCTDSNNSMRDRKPSLKVVHPYKEAPFILQAFDVTNRAFTDDNGTVVYGDKNPSDPKQLWVPDLMAQRCDTLKIPLNECSITRLCSTNPEDVICREYCSDSQNTGACDSWVLQYCKSKPTNRDFCGCINIGRNPGIDSSKWDALAGRPECHAASCATNSNAYLMERHRHKERCPNDTWCIVNIGGTNATVEAQNNVINQDCNSATSSSNVNNTNNVTNNQTTGNWDTNTGTTTTTKVKVNVAGAVVGGILILIGIVIGLFLLFSGGRRRRHRRHFRRH